ncbi:unnamed protein product [Lactuca saligna]|uniref:Uncharacterized protein n=1 Tax=Lactuca saligna TaxID=75948 RepID=A0AA36E7Z9_LACSI|nr:unnamed protein product [Lactuca saligna]
MIRELVLFNNMTGDNIMVGYNNNKFYIDIIESNPSNSISIIETDCEEPKFSPFTGSGRRLYAVLRLLTLKLRFNYSGDTESFLCSKFSERHQNTFRSYSSFRSHLIKYNMGSLLPSLVADSNNHLIKICTINGRHHF